MTMMQRGWRCGFCKAKGSMSATSTLSVHMDPDGFTCARNLKGYLKECSLIELADYILSHITVGEQGALVLAEFHDCHCQPYPSIDTLRKFFAVAIWPQTITADVVRGEIERRLK